jgi:hypothetical protein
VLFLIARSSAAPFTNVNANILRTRSTLPFYGGGGGGGGGGSSSIQLRKNYITPIIFFPLKSHLPEIHN